MLCFVLINGVLLYLLCLWILNRKSSYFREMFWYYHRHVVLSFPLAYGAGGGGGGGGGVHGLVNNLLLEQFSQTSVLHKSQ